MRSSSQKLKLSFSVAQLSAVPIEGKLYNHHIFSIALKGSNVTQSETKTVIRLSSDLTTDLLLEFSSNINKGLLATNLKKAVD